MIQASCHCGAVFMQIDTPPVTVTECGCSNCRKRGALWAYYSPKQVQLIAPQGATAVYTWNGRNSHLHDLWLSDPLGPHRQVVRAHGGQRPTHGARCSRGSPGA